MSRILGQSGDFHDTHNAEDLCHSLYSVPNLTEVVETIYANTITLLIEMSLVTIDLSVRLGPLQGVIILVTIAAYIEVSRQDALFLKKVHNQLKKTIQKESDATGRILNGWPTILGFNQAKVEGLLHSVAVQARVIARNISIRSSDSSALKTRLVCIPGLAASVLAVLYQIARGKATPGEFAVILALWSTLSSQIQRVTALLEPLSVQDSEGAQPLQLKGGRIEFRDVSFSYGDKAVLKNFSLVIEPRSTVSFVGRTGGGKSTILALLQRLYNVTEGQILIDNQDIQQVTIESLRATSVVPQSPPLLHGTISENIRYGQPNASKEDIQRAAEAAAIHDRIIELPEGGILTSRKKLSSGQIQRIQLARTFIHTAPIVLFDEPTSSVDANTEHQIQKALNKYTNGKTVIIVAHRLSTIANADKICLIEDGQVAESGTFDELIMRKGKFAKLWKR
ncbi:hypothetical protein E0Z10_g8756 [Xylaria hypoxylon]|uniref:ABC transporter domain-containing protein n=1 Tax=Xylaria hypoxylon TaxID=37992 RepID=A0A4Z0YR25_9PEZI|nr:hypothetical protein E0Z10_g8756 [Xylaria hypoxylon]